MPDISNLIFVLCPGHVTSKNDGDTHFIGAVQLIKLYGLKSLNLERGQIRIKLPDMLDRGRERARNEVYLYPKYNGDYDLEKEIQRYTARQSKRLKIEV